MPKPSYTPSTISRSTILTMSTRSEPWQIDLAIYEKAIQHALTSHDNENWTVSELLSLPADRVENLRFVFQKGAALMESNWNIDEFYAGEVSMMCEQKVYVVIFREGLLPSSRRVSAEEFEFLKFARDGATLLQLVERFQDHKWAHWLTNAASTGTIRPILR